MLGKLVLHALGPQSWVKTAVPRHSKFHFALQVTSGALPHFAILIILAANLRLRCLLAVNLREGSTGGRGGHGRTGLGGDAGAHVLALGICAGLLHARHRPLPRCACTAFTDCSNTEWLRLVGSSRHACGPSRMASSLGCKNPARERGEADT